MKHQSKNTLRWALASLTTVALAGSMAACGPSVPGAGGGSSEKGQSEATDWSLVEPAKKISYWSNHPGNSIEIEKKLVKEFTEKTGIEVDLVTGGSGYEELYQSFMTAQTGGEVGDLVVLADVTWFSAYLADTLLPVDEVLVAADADPKTYQQTFYDDYLYDGSHWAVPYARSTPIFFYNKDHYRKAGLGEEAPTTWEELAEYSRQLHDKVGGISLAWAPEDDGPAWAMSSIVWSFGGQYSDKWDFSTMSDKGTTEAFQWAQDSVQEGWGSVVQETVASFASGAASQVLGSTGAIRSTMEAADFDFGIGYIPTGKSGDKDVVPAGGGGLGIAKASTPERQLAAAMLADFLTSAESTAVLSEGTGYLPVRQDVDMDAIYAENPLYVVAVEQIERIHPQDYARVFLPGGERSINAAINTVLTTDGDVKQALEKAQSELEELFERDVKSKVQ